MVRRFEFVCWSVSSSPKWYITAHFSVTCTSFNVLRKMNTLWGEAVQVAFGIFSKEVHSKRTTSAPFFPSRVDVFLEEAQCTGKQRKSHKSCSPCKKWRKALPRVPSYLNSFGAKFQTTFVVCFLILTNCHLERRLYVKLTVRQRRSRWDGSLSRLI